MHRENGTYLIILDAIKKIRKIIGENKINELTTINPKKYCKMKSGNINY